MAKDNKIQCIKCGFQNNKDSKYCSQCGTQLEPVTAEVDKTIKFEPIGLEGEETRKIEVSEEDLGEAGACLVIAKGLNAGAKFTLNKTETTIGRHPESNIFLNDITVSRRHAKIVSEPYGFVIQDVGSLNGTYVNNVRIDEVVIQHQDELQIGRFKLVLVFLKKE